jgi:acetyl-CoA acetyltransferase
MTVFGRHFERSLEDLAREAAGRRDQRRGLLQAGRGNGLLRRHHQWSLARVSIAIPGQVVLGKLGIEGIPVYNIDNGCAAGSHRPSTLAVQSLKAGTTDVALALGAEKMNVEDKLSSAGKLMESRVGRQPRR